jgi:hypothetical protein
MMSYYVEFKIVGNTATEGYDKQQEITENVFEKRWTDS